MRKLLCLMVVFMVGLLLAPAANALNEENFGWKIEVNGDEVFFGNDYIELTNEDGDVIGEDTVYSYDGVELTGPSVSIEEGETVDVKVTLYAQEAVDDIEVEAEIKGYEYSDYESLSDSTHMFDMSANTQKSVRLSIDLPRKLEKQVYWLRLRIDNAASRSVERVVKLNVEPTRHGVDIADVVFSPGTSVKAGRSLLTSVLIENFGDKDEKDAKVTVAIPALGISATEFVDVVETDSHNVEYEDVPEMFLPIPATAATGSYEVVVSVQYDDLRETVSKRYTVNVVENEMFQTSDKLVLAVGPESQTVAAGKAAMYGIALTNAGRTSKAYTLDVVTGDWATAKLSDSLVVLEPGKNKVVYVELTPAVDAPQGEHLASVNVKSGSEMLETVVLRANVVPNTEQTGTNINLRNGLEIALIVLVVLLVIIGLIIGFSRLRKDEDEEEQTYY